MANSGIHRNMITRVALALGPDLLESMAFVGGCTTGLLLTDDFSLEQVRHTDDVDLIVHVIGTTAFSQLQQQLRKQGFKDSQDPDDPICAMRLGELRVDFMPDDEGILGFSNRWYRDAMATAENYSLTDVLTIRLVTPPYFVATKLEAYRGRGNNDPLGSRDIEDLLNLFDGRAGLLQELETAPLELRVYIAEQLQQLLDCSDFEYAVQSCALGDSGREELIFQRIEQAVQAGQL